MVPVRRSTPSGPPQTCEKRLELDGQTFVFTGEDCTVAETSFGLLGMMGEEAERVSLATMGRLVGDAWANSIAVEAVGSGVVIHSQGDAVETPDMDGSGISVEADFVRSESGNFDDVEESGTGRRGELRLNGGISSKSSGPPTRNRRARR